MLFEKVRAHGAQPRETDPDDASSISHPASKNVELRWQRAKPQEGTQLIGRTQGDLIVAMGVTDESQAHRVGTFGMARVYAASPMILHAAPVSSA